MTSLATIPSPRRAWREARTGPSEYLAGALLMAAVAVGAWGGWLPGVALAIAGGIALVGAFMDPRLFLLAYVALIPFEGSTALGGITNLSRFAGIAFAAGYLVRRRGGLRLDTIPIGGWLFLGVACASYLWSVDRGATLPQLLTLIQLFVIAVLVADYVAVEKVAARSVALAYAASAVATACIGIWIWLTNPGSLIAGRATAFAGQDSAQFTSILIPALLVLVWEALRRPRILPIIGAAITIVAILASGTRSAWLAIGIAVAAGILPRITWRQRLGIGVAVAVVAVVALVVPPLYTDSYGRLADAISSGGSGRIDIWLIGLQLFPAHPLVGVGYGAFPSVMTLEAVRATALVTPDTGFLTPPIGSHSIIVGTLVELGVVGFAFVAAFLWSVARPHRGDLALAEFARLAVLTMLVQALFLDVLGRKQLWLFIALAGGLTVASASRKGATRVVESVQVVHVLREQAVAHALPGLAAARAAAIGDGRAKRDVPADVRAEGATVARQEAPGPSRPDGDRGAVGRRVRGPRAPRVHRNAGSPILDAPGPAAGPGDVTSPEAVAFSAPPAAPDAAASPEPVSSAQPPVLAPRAPRVRRKAASAPPGATLRPEPEPTLPPVVPMPRTPSVRRKAAPATAEKKRSAAGRAPEPAEATSAPAADEAPSAPAAAPTAAAHTAPNPAPPQRNPWNPDPSAPRTAKDPSSG